MMLRMLLAAILLIGATAVPAGDLTSEEPKSVSRPASPTQKVEEPRCDSESMIDTWVEYAMPGQHHQVLRRLVGSWKTAIKYRMNSESPVVESEGTCERKWILGNRFVLEEFDGGNLGMPFQALAIYGYDTFEKKYTSVWVDTTSNAMTRSFGICQDECKVITFTGRHGDPWSGSMRTSRGVTRLVDDNKHVLELYEPDSTGTEFKVLEITYTRK